MQRRVGKSAARLAGLALPLLLVACGDAVDAGGAGLRILPDPRAAMADSEVLPGAELDAQGRYALLSSRGLVFHRTAAPVGSLMRRLVVAGAATVGDVDDREGRGAGESIELYTWQETQPDGSRLSFFAYTRDGRELLGRVRSTEYKLRLADAQFDPLNDPPPQLAGLLPASPSGSLFLVQFHATPLPPFQQAIEAAGGKVLRFLSDHTFLIELPAARRESVATLPYVRWLGAYLPAYRLEQPLRQALAGEAPSLPVQRYSIMLGEGGAVRQQGLAARVRAIGGQVELIEGGGMRIEATLSQDQLAQLVSDDAVQFIDRWGGPGEVDMDVVREVGGANTIERLTGWNGQGVRGEVFDTELRQDHQEWPRPPIIHSTGATTGGLHGSSCFGINFAQGKNAAAKGMLPGGQGVFFLYTQSSQFGGTKSRYDINKELTDPMGSLRAVFQTSSVGSSLTTSYTTVSAEVDDYLFKHPILSTQSQSNAGSPMSRPQAWAKNIVSVGAVRHQNTANRSDDTWRRSGSTGPAADGRVKPDLMHYFDSIATTSGSNSTSYTMFGGTSAATPITAGHFGLLFQMWHEGVWPGFGKKADVFSSRPQMATAKALMINSAWRYDWLQGGPNADIDRNVQGWGMPDVARLYSRARSTQVIDETDVIKPLGKRRYWVEVRPDEELAVTLVYTDPMGTVGAAQARVNDLSLRVVGPDGSVYWGNSGLRAGNVSQAGGTSNTIDTVENVFLPAPLPGRWRVEVLADELVKDGNPKTPEVDAVFALVIGGIRRR